ncbi:DUF6519 domain-containing protein [Umezawaea beigongshangensis]|uniref:DUF6519 domain-containing protein n=1 Tax=Umezawaea beigongshangensis TaxID=2780383 RepID=UPI0018F2726B|nr:DUF6519 domain-containing protein [Umezawaea beigongshangensis]
MQADLSRLVFRPENRFSAVLAQQGRVQLDADANEQVLIALHRDRTTVVDLVGGHGGPAGATGFGIAHTPKGRAPADLTISPGRYYVDGILVDAGVPRPGTPVPEETDADEPAAEPSGWTYWNQPDAHRDPEFGDEEHHLPDVPFLVRLAVTERLVTHVQDPSIRETALGSSLPDTTARVKVTWQVLPLVLEVGPRAGRDAVLAAFDEWVAASASTARMAARTERPSRVEDDPCVTAPDSRYRGPENQLYRVEVHRGGTVGDRADRPTLKWSRENASVVFGVASVEGAVVTLADRGRDGKLDLDVGDWVEVLDDAALARGSTAPLVQVVDVDSGGLLVELSAEPENGGGPHPFLRRWDHRAPTGRGARKLVGGALQLTEGGWLDLEDGVQVWFAEGGDYRAGDHWLLPARTLTGDVEWPRDARGRPLLRSPHGVVHHHAPLAWVTASGVQDLRNAFAPLATPLT